jgi:tetratricopeptide (TPR) repeat protein
MRSDLRILVLELSLLAIALCGCVSCHRSPQDRYAAAIKNGEGLRDKKDFARAILEFKNAIRYLPTDADAYYQLGVTYLSTGRTSEAAAMFQRAAEVNPKFAPAQLQLAELFLRTQNQDFAREAENRAARVLSLYPENRDALFLLAESKVELGDLDQALNYLQQMLSAAPADLRAALETARLKMAKHDPQGARTVLEQIVARAPQSPDGLVAAGLSYVSLGDYQTARSLYRRALAMNSVYPAGLINLGALSLHEGDFMEAEKDYRVLSRLKDPRYRSVYGLYLLKTGRPDEAITELQARYREDPNDRELRTCLVKAYLNRKRFDDARQLLDLVLRKNPKDTDALLERSIIWIQSGRFSEAEQDLTGVLHFEQSAPAHYLLAVIRHRRGESNAEADELNRALALDPALLEARIDLAYRFLNRHDPRNALNILDAAPAQQKSAARYLSARNDAFLMAGDLASARKQVNQSLAQSPESPAFQVQDGLLKIAEKDYGAARRVFESVLKTSPGDLAALQGLLETYVRENRRGAATDRLRAMAVAQPNSIPVHLILGVWLIENRSPDEAREVLFKAKQLDSTALEPDLALAQLDLSQGKLEDARRRLAQAASAHPESVAVHLFRGSTERNAGNLAEAAAEYEKALQFDEHNVIALNNLANAVSLLPGRLGDALKYASQASELAPDSPVVSDTLGWICYRRGDYPQAERELRRALSADPRPVIKYHLGMTLIKAGNQSQGAALLAAALEENPKLAETEVSR